MRILVKMISAVALLIMVAACVTTKPVDLPAKYNLDNDLQSVKRISASRVSNWEQADDQSLIIGVNGGQYYLLVLDRPLDAPINGETIGISEIGTSITSGYDKVVIRFSSGIQYYVIQKMYGLKDRAQAIEYKDKLGK